MTLFDLLPGESPDRVFAGLGVGVASFGPRGPTC
jgi:hypothetical protein